VFQSNQSLYTRGNVAGSAIAEQVIPELDELQATVISMRKPEPRPHIQDIFAVAVPTTPSPTVEGPPPDLRFKKSAPLSVPAVGKPRPRRQASTDSSSSEVSSPQRYKMWLQWKLANPVIHKACYLTPHQLPLPWYAKLTKKHPCDTRKYQEWSAYLDLGYINIYILKSSKYYKNFMHKFLLIF
jgi:hypothetical protein